MANTSNNRSERNRSTRARRHLRQTARSITDQLIRQFETKAEGAGFNYPYWLATEGNFGGSR